MSITRLDDSAAGRFQLVPRCSVSAQGESEAGADLRISESALVAHRARADEVAWKAVFGVRVPPFCEPVRLGTSMQFCESPKLGRFPRLKILQSSLTETLPELVEGASGFGLR